MSYAVQIFLDEWLCTSKVVDLSTSRKLTLHLLQLIISKSSSSRVELYAQMPSSCWISVWPGLTELWHLPCLLLWWLVIEKLGKLEELRISCSPISHCLSQHQLLMLFLLDRYPQGTGVAGYLSIPASQMSQDHSCLIMLIRYYLRAWKKWRTLTIKGGLLL